MQDMHHRVGPSPGLTAALLGLAIVLALGGCRDARAQRAPAAPPHPPAAAAPPISADRLAQAIDRNPNMPASATCHRATAQDRRTARTFATTKRLFVCRIALAHQDPATFDVQLLGNRCFVAERRRPGQADYGCVRSRR